MYEKGIRLRKSHVLLHDTGPVEREIQIVSQNMCFCFNNCAHQLV